MSRRRLGVGFDLAFLTFANLCSIHNDVRRGLDTNEDSVAPYAYHGDTHIVTDLNAFLDPAIKYQHSVSSSALSVLVVGLQSKRTDAFAPRLHFRASAFWRALLVFATPLDGTVESASRDPEFTGKLPRRF
jgi:hypothetical protein